MKSDIFVFKEELHILKTEKQLFPGELKRPASSITSTPKKMRSETVTVPLQDTVSSEYTTFQLMYEQSPLQEDDFCMQAENNKTHKKE